MKQKKREGDNMKRKKGWYGIGKKVENNKE